MSELSTPSIFQDLLADFERRPLFYRRDGRPYEGSFHQQTMSWGRDYELAGNSVVVQDWTPYGEGLSTVWLGTSGDIFGPPRIFETVLFGRGNPRKLDSYYTELQARDGHAFWFYWLLIPPLLRDRVERWVSR